MGEEASTAAEAAAGTPGGGGALRSGSAHGAGARAALTAGGAAAPPVSWGLYRGRPGVGDGGAGLEAGSGAPGLGTLAPGRSPLGGPAGAQGPAPGRRLGFVPEPGPTSGATGPKAPRGAQAAGAVCLPRSRGPTSPRGPPPTWSGRAAPAAVTPAPVCSGPVPPGAQETDAGSDGCGGPLSPCGAQPS